MAETDLYAPVKAFLESRGFAVKAEVGGVDVMACRDDEPPVIVELKAGFSLVLLHQACDRLALTERVYVCVPRRTGRASWSALKANIKLCRRLGLGVITVRPRDGLVEVHVEPGPYAPRRNKTRTARLLRDFARLDGDPNLGGTRGRVMTAYRQDARAVAMHLADAGPSKGADVARATGVPNATRIMADNHYGWFRRLRVGVYELTETGRAMADAPARMDSASTDT
ncbi:DUF2161 family putative PD-(D/E)XK-type phosphodiesterase [Lutimaribacter sp. EGI FJ00015]|uniref:DUF2161 family putative PD-(D/E)XK-type phosphodiesterase n=1 Tax=Lutimaribacter degradans TaxID=2945989 RepID=A0ACC5ZX89_9RHOB|nr:DUF2161 family putative PD-(D/E)XK-type phosphodiesterase [Lutimaribacter sp. EGI FJ00013]MCM2562677.1 DUF2161 family putative PD-(D/E)XK-type phosphodiesterase [Lutimaribacter sp. EGI FJ00013]MCO0613834.1 DUF2161 family putative PD-(D/E)XK-type phosphodiesterase [Lutimaribacter sp. EGI FJ00015]MCO0636683.1 DUF2161 family putative PD-(D/E)XK-type phosphodiesterase [Lutimaribacter sp. EGI FJ00014]